MSRLPIIRRVKLNHSHNHYTFPSDEGSFWSISTALEEAVTEFVPLDGAEDGVGSFLGSICSQLYALGNLVPSETKTRASKLKTKHLCLQETVMMSVMQHKSLWFHLFLIPLWTSYFLGRLWEADMSSNLRSGANLFVWEKMKQLADNAVIK